MANIPNAKPSPRVERDGVIYWYSGDTFEIGLKIELKDEHGTPIPLQDGDTITVVFRPKGSLSVVKSFEYTAFEDSTIVLDFDAETTKLFKTGQYTYDIFHAREYRRTIAKNNGVTVE